MFKKIRRKSINRIIEDNLDYLVRFAYYRLGNRNEAEDIVYDAILKFLENNRRDIKPESVRLYLFKTVYNLCVDRTRTGKQNLIPIESIDIEESPEDGPDQEEADRINACLERLPSWEAEIIRMNVIDGLSFVKISNLLSIPQSTAKSRFKSGMNKLRKLFINNQM